MSNEGNTRFIFPGKTKESEAKELLGSELKIISVYIVFHWKNRKNEK